jgi:hypothetical protein
MKNLKLLLLLIAIGIVVFQPLAFTASQIIRLGMEGEAVYSLQQRLHELGYYQETLDGKFGVDTQTAVVNFQIDSGLDPDGIVGMTTWQLLKEPRTMPIVSRATGENRKRLQVVSLATHFRGVPYIWGGRDPGGFDCSGFTYYIFKQYGIPIPRMADEQFEVGLSIMQTELQKGDLVFFSTYEPGPSHVGIYIGNGYFIHASSGANGVTVTPMNKPYYQERYVGARRLIK